MTDVTFPPLDQQIQSCGIKVYHLHTSAYGLIIEIVKTQKPKTKLFGKPSVSNKNIS